MLSPQAVRYPYQKPLGIVGVSLLTCQMTFFHHKYYWGGLWSLAALENCLGKWPVNKNQKHHSNGISSNSRSAW